MTARYEVSSQLNVKHRGSSAIPNPRAGARSSKFNSRAVLQVPEGRA